jgi:hypothetical protein
MVKVFLLIVVGLVGPDSPEHAELFRKWGATLADSSERLGVTKDRLVYLVDEPGEGDKRATGPATKDEVTKALERFAAEAGPEDLVFVTLIGHGDFDGRMAKFNLVGRDITPPEFDALFDKMRAKQIVFVDTSAASGPFVETLSAPGRTVVTATRNGSEKYATLFGGPFVEALTSEAADQDKNRRISVLEAFLYAKAEVERGYKREGLLQTEHAVLDDDGDKEGSQTPAIGGKDGKIAAVLSLGSMEAATPKDPKLAAQYDERRDLERRMENLRLLKDSLDPARYASELEKLATELARKSREIREAEAAGQK